MAADCQRQCCSLKPISRPLLPMPILWATGWVLSITCIARVSSGAPALWSPRPNTLIRATKLFGGDGRTGVLARPGYTSPQSGGRGGTPLAREGLLLQQTTTDKSGNCRNQPLDPP